MTRKTTQTKSELVQAATGRPERMKLSDSRDKLYEKFYNNIRLLAASETISMVDLSRKLGLKSGARITDMCYGRAVPNTEELIVISKHFKCTIDDLLNRSAVISFIEC